MTDALYLEDSYLREWDTKVVSATGKFVVLEQTGFFPKGGGVEWDTGTITRENDGKQFSVIFTGKFKGEISLEVDQEGLQSGEAVRCSLDWDRRYLLMRYHTAAHVLSGVFYNEFGLKITGNNLTPEKGRIDFDMETMDLELIRKGFVRANELVAKDLPVEIYTIKKEEADKSLFKLAMNFPHDLKELRIVDIKGFDAQADGGCHVKSLSFIGKIIFMKAVNKGKSNRRVYFQVK